MRRSISRIMRRTIANMAEALLEVGYGDSFRTHVHRLVVLACGPKNGRGICPAGRGCAISKRQYCAPQGDGKPHEEFIDMKEKAQPDDLPLDEQAHRRRIITRLARIEGQVRGIQAMISDCCSCDQVAVQMTAARRALDKAFYEMLACSLNSQVTASSNMQEVRASTQDLAKLLAKFG